MARALRDKQPTSSVFRLLDFQAAAGATRPVAPGPSAPARLDLQPAVGEKAGPATGRRSDPGVNAATTEVQSLLDQYSYLYGTRPEFSFGFKWFSKGRAGGGTTVPPLFAAPASSKLMLEAAILLSYARSEGLPLFVVDPDGRFSDAVRSNRAQAGMGAPASALIQNCCEGATVIAGDTLLLDRWELFEQLLTASPFFELVQVRTQRKMQVASSLLVSRLRAAIADLTTLHHRSSFESAWHHVAGETFRHAIYAAGGAAAARLAGSIEAADRDELWRVWVRLCEPFQRLSPERGETRRPMMSLIEGAFRGPPGAIIFDISGCGARDLPWSDNARGLLAQRLLEGIQEASAAISSDGKVSNALVAVQETRSRSASSGPTVARRNLLLSTGS